ncbi:MAG: Tn3 family transposase [Holosporaceae bacterium]|nr:Tn3 family transposase [Holosporaceae bacterium]
MSGKYGLLAFPISPEEIAQHYTLSEEDIALIRQHRGDPQRFGFAVLLCAMRHPGIVLNTGVAVPEPVLKFIASQLEIEVDAWFQYAKRPSTRREHLLELQKIYDFRLFTSADYKTLLPELIELAILTDRGISIGEKLIEFLSDRKILAPVSKTIQFLCSEAVMKGTKELYDRLLVNLSEEHFARLDKLLTLREKSSSSVFAWLIASPGKPTPPQILKHLERLQYLDELDLPKDIEKSIHQNRLRKIAREGRQMTAQHLRDFEKRRRYATLVAVCIESRSSVIDECIDLQERHLRKLQRRAKLKHAEHFINTGKSMSDVVLDFAKIMQAILKAQQDGTDIKVAIENVTTWEELATDIEAAERLCKPKNFNPIAYIDSSYASVRSYSPQFLEALKLKGSNSEAGLLGAVELLKKMNAEGLRKLPPDAPVDFVSQRWHPLVFTDEGLNRHFYEFCVLTEIKNALYSGDLWIEDSRRFRAFDDHLIPMDRFEELKKAQKLPVMVTTDCEEYLDTRIAFMEARLDSVEAQAKANLLPNAVITEGGITISPLDKNVPAEAEVLQAKIESMLPRIKITDLLMEVDQWTNFSEAFVSLKNGEPVKDRLLLYTILLADGINLGLRKMSEACPGMSYPKLSWLQSWFVRSDTYTAALAKLINTQHNLPFSAYWGDGTTSSSDGQFFSTTGHARISGQINMKYGLNPGKTLYSFVSDQHGPFHPILIHSPIGDAPYVMDGLMHHETDLKIREHYTDTAGFTEHVFALMHFIGFRFAPRIKRLKDNKLYVPANGKTYDTLSPLIAPNRLNLKCIRQQWDAVLRLAASIKTGTVTSSLMLRALGRTRLQSSLAVALRELGRIERTLFMLDWFQSEELRRRVQIGLNKGEAHNSLARAVFFNRLGEIRDRTLHAQEHRMSGLNFLTAAIVLWNTVYIERAVETLRQKGERFDENLLQYTSPLPWEHIALTGDYLWETNRLPEEGKYRPLMEEEI